MTSSESNRPHPARRRDEVIRAMTDDRAFRVIAAELTETTSQILGAQGMAGGARAADSNAPARDSTTDWLVARALAELVVGTVLLRETMSPDLRVQGILKGSLGGSLVADSHPGGLTRGLWQRARSDNGEQPRFEVGEGALLQMMRSLPNGAVQQGIVEVPPAHAGTSGISGALMAYLQSSEQVTSVIGVGAHFERGGLVRAGGYVIQLLPESERKGVEIMVDRLDALPAMDQLIGDVDFSARGLLAKVLGSEVPHAVVGEEETHFGCLCSELRVISALSTLGRIDLEELASSREALETTCDYCGKEYAIDPERLRGMLQST
jgi:molecular chaperone Hsp33